MKCYTNCCDAISDLHKNGFVNDFELFGTNLLCIQEGFFLRPGEFAIVEYHKIAPSDIDAVEETIVFGILAPYHHMKGILLNHYKNYSKDTPEILAKKLNEYNAQRSV